MGTNFGFIDKVVQRVEQLISPANPYDYDALLNEAGNPTPYFCSSKMLKTYYPEFPQNGTSGERQLWAKNISLGDKVDLFWNLADLAEPEVSILKDGGAGTELYLFTLSYRG